MHILISPNSFKNSLNAVDTALAIGKGLEESRLDCTWEIFPIGDGGDGTANLLINKFKGKLVRIEQQFSLKNILVFEFVEGHRSSVLPKMLGRGVSYI